MNLLIEKSSDPILSKIREKKGKPRAGRKPFDAVLMFKILVLQSLYNLSDDATEQQILDRLSFMRFLGLSIGDRVPDAKTIWLLEKNSKKVAYFLAYFGILIDSIGTMVLRQRKGK